MQHPAFHLFPVSSAVYLITLTRGSPLSTLPTTLLRSGMQPYGVLHVMPSFSFAALLHLAVWQLSL